MRIRGWDVRCGKANASSFHHAGLEWTPGIEGFVAWLGIAPIVMFYIAAWRAA